MQKKGDFFARIFDITMNIIISGCTNDHGKGDTRKEGKEREEEGEEEEEEEEERERDRPNREAHNDHMNKNPNPPPGTPNGIVLRWSGVQRF